MNQSGRPGHVSPLTLWSVPASLYSGKVRSYLLKKGLPFRERFPAHPRFAAEILPVVRTTVVPVLETAEGEVFQDSTVIIDELERRYAEPALVPVTPLLRAVAHLLDAFGSEGLLPQGMHYRWTYRDQQEHFLRAEFGRGLHHGPDREARVAAGAEFMSYFSGFLPALGIAPGTIPAFEQAYEDLLEALDIHFQHYPYLLGGRPSIADFGFMAPMFAHLGRDPVPASLMKRQAPNVYRWVERMNLAAFGDGEFYDMATEWYENDTIPATLEAVLRLVFQDWGTQLLAEAAFVNEWLRAHPDIAPGTLASADGEFRIHPILGLLNFSWRGVEVQRGCMPQGLWHFARAQQAAEQLDGEARTRFGQLLEQLGGEQMMAIRLDRPLARKEGALVFE